VGYIHLNPFRAGIVKTVQALKSYPFTGHCALIGKKEILWQDTEYVLALFGKTVANARKSYADYVSKHAGTGRRPELTGGGLIRSAGGWRAIREAYEEGIRLTSDERILGSSSFVEKTLASVGEDYDQRMRLKVSGIDLDTVMDVVSAHFGVDAVELSGPSRRQQICQARAVVSYLAVRELMISGANVARRMNIDRSSVSRAVGRVQADPTLKNMTKALLCHLHPED